MSHVRRTLLLPLRPLLWAAKLAIGAFVLGSELTRPLYRPVYDAVSRLAPVRRLETAIGRLHRYVILVLLAVPFLGVEPLKVLGIVWIAEGDWLKGAALLAGAYLASFVLVERIYAAGREKLLTIGWLAACIGFGVRVRDAALDRVRATAAWKSGAAAAASAIALARRLIAHVRPA